MTEAPDTVGPTVPGASRVSQAELVMSACSLSAPLTLAPEQDAPFRPRYLALGPLTDLTRSHGRSSAMLNCPVFATIGRSCKQYKISKKMFVPRNTRLERGSASGFCDLRLSPCNSTCRRRGCGSRCCASCSVPDPHAPTARRGAACSAPACASWRVSARRADILPPHCQCRRTCQSRATHTRDWPQASPGRPLSFLRGSARATSVRHLPASALACLCDAHCSCECR